MRVLTKACLCGLSLALTALSMAQEPLNLGGKVTDETGKGIEGVTLSLKGRKVTTRTLADGSYQFNAASAVSGFAPAAPPEPFSFDNRALTFEVGQDGSRVKVELLDLAGRSLATLVDGPSLRGSYRIEPDPAFSRSALVLLRARLDHRQQVFKLPAAAAAASPIAGLSAGRVSFERSDASLALAARASALGAVVSDTLIVSKTAYYPDRKRLDSYTGKHDFLMVKEDVFWGNPASYPASSQVMKYVLLNRTRGKFTDAQISWKLTGAVPGTAGKVKMPDQSGTLASQPFIDIPKHDAGRLTINLGTDGKYWDFIEQTVDNRWHGNTTRVDAYRLPLAMRLVCGDGTDILLGEKYEVFYTDRDKFFQKYKDAVPVEFDHTAEVEAPFAIIAPGKAGLQFGPPSSAKYSNYFNGYFSELKLSGEGVTTQKLFACEQPFFDKDAQLCGAIHRHVAHLPKSEWNKPENFYKQAPANYYAKFFHDVSWQEKAYGFAYDDAADMAAYAECGQPKTLVIAVGY